MDIIEIDLSSEAGEELRYAVEHGYMVRIIPAGKDSIKVKVNQGTWSLPLSTVSE